MNFTYHRRVFQRLVVSMPVLDAVPTASVIPAVKKVDYTKTRSTSPIVPTFHVQSVGTRRNNRITRLLLMTV